MPLPSRNRTRYSVWPFSEDCARAYSSSSHHISPPTLGRLADRSHPLRVHMCRQPPLLRVRTHGGFPGSPLGVSTRYDPPERQSRRRKLSFSQEESYFVQSICAIPACVSGSSLSDSFCRVRRLDSVPRDPLHSCLTAVRSSDEHSRRVYYQQVQLEPRRCSYRSDEARTPE
jgi:hypothetical protein